MKKVIIIGAGPAGVTAGYELLKRSKEYEVLILEESNVIGGISKTVNYKGNRMDMGGHRFFSKNERVMEWWREMLPFQGSPAYDDRVLSREVRLEANGPDPEKEDRVMLSRNRVSRIYYKKKFFDYPVKVNGRTIKNMGFGTTMVAGFSYLASVIHKRVEDSLEAFYINRFGRKLYSMFFEGYTEKLWGRHPREISADWGAQRVKGLSIVGILKDIFSKIFVPGDKRQVETSLIEEFYYPKYGPGQLWETVASECEKLGGRIAFSSKAVAVETEEGRVKRVKVVSPEGEHWLDTDILLSTMPLKDLVLGMNEVPENVMEVASGLPYRDYVTVGLLVKKLNLKNETKWKTLNNMIPDCWIYVQDTGVKLGRIQFYNNWSPYMVEKPEENVWIGLEYFCAEGDEYWNMSEAEWTKLGVSELLKMGVLNDGADVLDSHMEKIKKAYPAYFDTYDRIDEVVDYVNTFENLYCMGRNGQHRYNNMDHSMLTAFETVDCIISGKSDKKNIWKVNTEKEYHEKQ